jgi:hypothetical protein
MPYMSIRVQFRWKPEFLERVDVARGDVARSVFVRRAVERVLGEHERVEGLPPQRGTDPQRSDAPAVQVSRADAFRAIGGASRQVSRK